MTFVAPAAIYVKLHTGDPGDAGTANPAGNTTRQAVVFAAVSTPAGTMLSNGDVTWSGVPTAEIYSWATLWDAATGGNCLFVGQLGTAKSVGVGDNFTLPAGQITVALN